MSEIEKQAPSFHPEFRDVEIERSTKHLNHQMEQPGLGAAGKQELGERVMRITELIEASPERLAKDYGKHPDERTEYDIERARLMASATHKASSFITKDKARHEKGGKGDRWSKKRQRAEVAERLWTTEVGKIYDEDPLHAGPNRVERIKQIHKGSLFRNPEF